MGLNLLSLQDTMVPILRSSQEEHDEGFNTVLLPPDDNCRRKNYILKLARIDS